MMVSYLKWLVLVAFISSMALLSLLHFVTNIIYARLTFMLLIYRFIVVSLVLIDFVSTRKTLDFPSNELFFDSEYYISNYHTYHLTSILVANPFFLVLIPLLLDLPLKLCHLWLYQMFRYPKPHRV